MKKNRITLVTSIICLSILTGCGGKKVYNINLVGYSSSEIATVTNGSEYFFAPSEKKGYSFEGWYSEKQGGNALTDSNGNSSGLTWNSSNPTTLYAHYSPKDYEITFNYNGATSENLVTSLSATYDETMSYVFPTPKKEGFSFEGWGNSKFTKMVTNQNGELLDKAKKLNFKYYPNEDNGIINLYARWSKMRITFNYYVDNQVFNTTAYEFGTKANNIIPSSIDNYCFEGWYLDPTFITKYDFDNVIDLSKGTSINLYAKYIEANSKNISFSLINDDKEYSASINNNDLTNIVIPDSYYGKKVTKIDKITCPNVENVILSNNIKEISNGAFKDCKKLKEINIPLLVSAINRETFMNCESLNKIELSSNVETIGINAFNGCGNIENVFIPKSVTRIDKGAFSNMKKLKKFEVSNENNKYFEDEGVLYSKSGNYNILIQYPGCKEEKEYTIMDNCVKIMDYAFMDSNIEKIVIKNNIANIGSGAFKNCKKLLNVEINVTSSSLNIYEEAFANCINLKSIQILTPYVPHIENNTLLNINDTFKIYVKSTLIKQYSKAENWNKVANKIKSIGNIFGEYVLDEYEDGYIITQYLGEEKKLVIPEIINAKKILAIDNKSFVSTSLEEVTIPKTVKVINNEAFYYSSLEKVILECTPPQIGENVFNVNLDNFGIYVKNSSDVLDSYLNNEQWKVYKDIIWSNND